jgi:hypothetical protein
LRSPKNVSLLASAGAATTLEIQTAYLQLLDGRQQLEGKRIVDPVLIDDRLDPVDTVGATCLALI